MTRVDNNFEGGTNGVTISTANSGGASGTAFSTVSIGAGGTLTYSTTSPLDGSVSAALVVGTAANTNLFDLPVAANAVGSISMLFRLNALPSGTLQFPVNVRGNSGASTLGRVQLTNLGNMQAVCGAGSAANSTGAVVTGVDYRLEFRWAGFGTAGSAVACNVYNYETNELVLHTELGGQTTAFTVDLVRFGKNGGTGTVDCVLDRIRTDSSNGFEIGVDAAASAWPTVPFDTRVELSIDGEWTDIVRLDNGEAGVFGGNRAEINIGHGRESETQLFDTSKCTLRINNRDGRFSPRNAAGPYYGSLGRNTPIRISLPAESKAMWLNGGAGASATTPDSSTLSVLGDIDIRVDGDLDSWRNATELVAKWAIAAGQRSYLFYVDGDGRLSMLTSSNGTAIITSQSTSPVPIQVGRISVRATVDVNNGAAGNTVAFYYSYDTDLTAASWTQLGTSVVNSGTTSIFNGTSTVDIGDSANSSISANDTYAKFYSVQIRDTIGGTIVANPVFSSQAVNAGTFLDTASVVNAWTLSGGSAVSDRDFRFHGEVSAWPMQWDTTGEDVWTDVEASGVFRRLGQGASPAGSALYRGITALDSLVAYWPGEDGPDSTKVSSAAPSGRPMTSGAAGATTFSDYQGTYKSTLPIFRIGDNAFGGSVNSYVSTGNIQLQFLMHIAAADVPSTMCFMRLFCGGTAPRWDLVVDTSGDLTIQAYNGNDAILLNDGPYTGFDLDGNDLVVIFALSQNGSNVAYKVVTYKVGDSGGTVSTGTQSLASRTITSAGGIHLNPPGSAGLTDANFGHIAVLNAVDVWSTPQLQLEAYNGETAGARIQRLCGEEDIDFRYLGDLTDTTALGYQTSDTLLNTLQGAASADMGFLTESREFFGMKYRTRRALYNQNAKITIDYASHEMLTLSATDDDAATRNDVTVTRDEGGSDRQTKLSGTLSTLDPPNGVGRYDDNVTISLNDEDDIPQQASWRLHMGTMDEPRYTLEVELGQSEYRNDTDLFYAIRSLTEGDRIDITNPPSWLPPEDIHLIVQGIQEELNNFTHRFTISTQPYEPFDVGTYGVSRYSATGTVLQAAVDDNDTDLTLSVPSEDFGWSHADGDYDVMVGGERMTVTNVSVVALQFHLIVTRSVNGVTKSHTAGTRVDLFRPAYWAL